MYYGLRTHIAYALRLLWRIRAIHILYAYNVITLNSSDQCVYRKRKENMYLRSNCTLIV